MSATSPGLPDVTLCGHERSQLPDKPRRGIDNQGPLNGK